MEDQIIKKLQNHDQRFDSIDNRLDLVAGTTADNQKKLKEHDDRFDKLDQRVDTLDHKFDTLDHKFDTLDHKFDTLDHKFDTLDHKFDTLDQQVDTLAVTVVDIQEQVNDIKESMATKSDISNMSNALDELVGLAKKKDQELTFMGERVRRIEDDVKQLKPLSV